MLFFLIACPKPVAVSLSQQSCTFTIKVDENCSGYKFSRYRVFDENGHTHLTDLKPGEETTFQIPEGRFVMRRTSFAAPGKVFEDGFKIEKAEYFNFCEDKFTNQLVCD